ncbi:MAG: hypothetical protein R2705_13220 [Ilumatobacteraceae bacterium]
MSGAGGASDLTVAEGPPAPTSRPCSMPARRVIRLTGTVETEAQRQQLLNAATDASVPTT